MKSDEKVSRAIKSTKEFLARNQNRPSVDDNLNFTIIGCERRNLEVYKVILGKDKRTLRGFEKELYLAI